MSTRTDALTAIYNIARAMRAEAHSPIPHQPQHVALPGALVAQLYAALDAVDGGGLEETGEPGAAQSAQSDRRTQAPCGVCTTISWVEGPAGMWCAFCGLVAELERLARGQPATPRVDATRERPGLCAVAECWRTVEVGSTCYLHSEIAQRPHPWEQARMRDRALRGVGDG